MNGIRLSKVLRQNHQSWISHQPSLVLLQLRMRKKLQVLSTLQISFVDTFGQQTSLKMAGNLTKALLQHHIAPKLETIVDRQTKISHEGFAALIEARLGTDDKPPDMKVWEKGNLGKVCSSLRYLHIHLHGCQVDWQSVEFCYPTIIQSQTVSSGYDLKFTAQSTPDNIAYKGVFLVSVGMRYKSYCSSLGRSIMVDPTKVRIALLAYSSITSALGTRSDLCSSLQPTNGTHAKTTRWCRDS